MILKIDDKPIEVKWQDSPTLKQLQAQVEKETITIVMSRYGGWEQFGPLGRTYISADVRMTTDNGDIVLYNSDQLVVFYGQNTWEYTYLGKMQLDSQEVTALLSQKDVTITLGVK